jgi:hypothetical protein
VTSNASGEIEVVRSADAGDGRADEEDHYALGIVVMATITIAVAIFAGAFWHYLLAALQWAACIIAIVVGYIQIRRRRPQSSSEL